MASGKKCFARCCRFRVCVPEVTWSPIGSFESPGCYRISHHCPEAYHNHIIALHAWNFQTLSFSGDVAVEPFVRQNSKLGPERPWLSFTMLPGGWSVGPVISELDSLLAWAPLSAGLGPLPDRRGPRQSHLCRCPLGLSPCRLPPQPCRSSYSPCCRCCFCG